MTQILEINMDTPLHYIKLEMDACQMNNGIIINILDVNFTMLKVKVIIILQLKISYNVKILTFQQNGIIMM